MLERIKAAVSSHPAARQLAEIAAAEQRVNVIVDKLTTLQQQRQEAEQALQALQPEGIDADADLDAAAGRFVQQHAGLAARVQFAKAAASKLRAELAEARKAIVDAEKVATRRLQDHFAAAAENRLQRLAATLRPELELLAAEFARRDGYAIPADAVVGELQRAIWPNGWTCTLGAAESAIPKPAPIAASTVVTAEHRAGRSLDRLLTPTPGRDAAVLRRQLAGIAEEMEQTRHQLSEAERLGQVGVAQQRRQYLETLTATLAELHRDLAHEEMAEAEAELA